MSSDSPVAPLYTLRKDLKQCSNDFNGPPVRPVCGAVVEYNMQAFTHDEYNTQGSMEVKRKQRHTYEYGRHDS